MVESPLQRKCLSPFSLLHSLSSKGYLVGTVHKGASTNLRATFSGDDDDDNPYQHGIPGIPTDGKVVLLKNSKLKSKVYLVGTVHISKQSAETVKKVINYVKPNVLAVELCSESAAAIMTCNLKEDVTLLDILYRSMTAPWGLRMKIGMFAVDCWNRQLRADGILQVLEFKVAIQESSKLGARCVLMDQDHNVTNEKISEVLSWNLLWNCLLGDYKDLFTTEYATRSSVQEEISLMKKQNPENEALHESPSGSTERNNMSIFAIHHLVFDFPFWRKRRN
ncbi:hypothetical protein MKW92_002292 [Papaver armeniacum]|nr:hypothetical protein MKW92_002292 [Papaver armeniacum]